MTGKDGCCAPKSLAMGTRCTSIFGVASCDRSGRFPVQSASGESPWQVVVPEQRRIQVRHPSDLPHAPVPETPQPPTVSNPQRDAVPREFSLDEAIRIALVNANVVRVLTGVTAVSSGSTIYDAAITNTTIDQERARLRSDGQRHQFVGSLRAARRRFRSAGSHATRSSAASVPTTTTCSSIFRRRRLPAESLISASTTTRHVFDREYFRSIRRIAHRWSSVIRSRFCKAAESRPIWCRLSSPGSTRNAPFFNTRTAFRKWSAA